MTNLITRFIRDESGATAIEYGLIAALIAVVIITGVTAVGTQLSTAFTNLAGNLKLFQTIKTYKILNNKNNRYFRCRGFQSIPLNIQMS